MTSSRHRITFVQFSGDFREAAERLAAGGRETYKGQRYTVDYVNRLAPNHESVATITGLSRDAYDVVLPSGVRAIGAGFAGDWRSETIVELIERTRPNRIVLRTPRIHVLRTIARSAIPTLAMFADSVQRGSIRNRLKLALLAHYLNTTTVERIGNHGANATRQLIEAGVDKDKVAAWDYPPTHTPLDRSPKTNAIGRKMLYVGLLEASKGVDDLLAATAELLRSGVAAELELIGVGDRDRLLKCADTLNIRSNVRFSGLVPNDEIIERMSAADVVIVPSRHACPEGLPLTIYEAFCSRTPLVVSDHPMFVNNVEHEKSGLVFREGDHKDLAASIRRLFEDRALYRLLSCASELAFKRIQVAYTWGAMIDDWLNARPLPNGLKTSLNQSGTA